MASFPSLSINPVFSITERWLDNSVVTTSEHGYVHGRMKFTRKRRVWGVPYEGLTGADKTALDSHVETHGKAVTFEWTHPVTSVTHTVRFLTLPEYEYSEFQRYNAQFEVLEV